MTIKKRKDTDENKAFWAFVEETSKRVEENFPSWKRGDVSQCDSGTGHEKPKDLPSYNVSKKPTTKFD